MIRADFVVLLALAVACSACGSNPIDCVQGAQAEQEYQTCTVLVGPLCGDDPAATWTPGVQTQAIDPEPTDPCAPIRGDTPCTTCAKTECCPEVKPCIEGSCSSLSSCATERCPSCPEEAP